MKIKVVNKSVFELPSYETILSSGMDLRADFTGIVKLPKEIGDIKKVVLDSSVASSKIDKIILNPQCRAIIPTNLYMAIEEGYEGQVRPRSGLSIKKGLTIPNAPGTIDADYRGNIGVIVANFTDKKIEIQHGERIAQIVFSKVEQCEFEEVDTLEETIRGEGGFGHTGNK